MKHKDHIIDEAISQHDMKSKVVQRVCTWPARHTRVSRVSDLTRYGAW